MFLPVFLFWECVCFDLVANFPVCFVCFGWCFVFYRALGFLYLCFWGNSTRLLFLYVLYVEQLGCLNVSVLLSFCSGSAMSWPQASGLKRKNLGALRF